MNNIRCTVARVKNLVFSPICHQLTHTHLIYLHLCTLLLLFKSTSLVGANSSALSYAATGPVM